MQPENLVHFQDIGFSVVHEARTALVDFYAYQIVGNAEDGSYLYQRKGSDCLDPVADIEEAEVFVSGAVRWDGCSDWRFDEQDRCALHACSYQELLDWGELLGRCHELTKELIDTEFHS